MNYDEWQESVPEEIRQDTLWQKTVYRQALFANDLAWVDIEKLVKDRRTVRVADQLYRSVGSISAILAEGYSHNSQKIRRVSMSIIWVRLAKLATGITNPGICLAKKFAFTESD